VAPVAAVYLFVDIDAFAALGVRQLRLPIQWETVTPGQWRGLWLLTALHLGVGLSGLYFLRRAFVNFSRGEFFNQSNSRDLRLFSILLFVQAFTKPLHTALSSVLLSWNHPPGQKVLSVSFGSGEVQMIVLAMILWVICDLLVRGGELEHENRQFV
jgi:hypothetical protein